MSGLRVASECGAVPGVDRSSRRRRAGPCRSEHPGRGPDGDSHIRRRPDTSRSVVRGDGAGRAAARASGDVIVTTVVVLMARGDHFACLWAGDSRAYLLRDGVLRQMTRDHSLVQELVDAGSLAPEDAEAHPQANIITRAVGSEEPLQLDKVAGTLLPGDVILLCTDGLFKALREPEMAHLLAAGAGPQELLDTALKAG